MERVKQPTRKEGVAMKTVDKILNQGRIPIRAYVDLKECDSDCRQEKVKRTFCKHGKGSESETFKPTNNWEEEFSLLIQDKHIGRIMTPYDYSLIKDFISKQIQLAKREIVEKVLDLKEMHFEKPDAYGHEGEEMPKQIYDRQLRNVFRSKLIKRLSELDSIKEK